MAMRTVKSTKARLNRRQAVLLKQSRLLDGIATGKIPSTPNLGIPLSLRPGSIILACATGTNPIALAVRDAWRPAFSVHVLPSTEFDGLANSTIFCGMAADARM